MWPLLAILLEEIGRGNSQSGRKLRNDIDGRARLRCFDGANPSPVDARPMGQLLLREAQCLASSANVFCKDLTMFHRP